MPFELGLAVALALVGAGQQTHQFRILERKQYRLHQSLSDLLGHDPYIHRGCSEGVLECLLDVFPHLDAPSLPEMKRMSRELRRFRRERIGKDAYTPKAFSTLVVAARKLVDA